MLDTPGGWIEGSNTSAIFGTLKVLDVPLILAVHLSNCFLSHSSVSSSSSLISKTLVKSASLTRLSFVPAYII